MAYVFIDDGEPEATEYDTNYVAFDPADEEQSRNARELLLAAMKRRLRDNTPARRVNNRYAALCAVC